MRKPSRDQSTPDDESRQPGDRFRRLERAEGEKEVFVNLARRLAGATSADAVMSAAQEASDRLLAWDFFYLAHRLPGSDQFKLAGVVDTIDGKKVSFPAEHNVEAAFSPALRQVLAGTPLLIKRREGETAPSLSPLGSGRISASLLYVPVRCEDRVIGLLSAQSYEPNRYNQSDLRLLQDIADAVAPAMERIRAEESLRSSQQLLHLERDLAIALSAMREVDEGFNYLLEVSLQLEGIDCGGVYLVDPITHDLSLACHVNLSTSFIDRVKHLAHDSRQAAVVAEAKPVYLATPELHAIDATCRDEGLQSLAVVPVAYAGGLIAVLNLASRRLKEIPHHFRHVIEAVAAQMGAAVVRIRAEQSLREARDQLEQRVQDRTAELLDANVRLQAEILERRRAEQALAASEQKYRLVIEMNAIGFLILDEQGRVLDANQEYVRLTGRTSLDEILGKSVTEWTAEQDRERNAEEVRKCLRIGSVRDLEINYCSPDGKMLPVEIHAAVLRTADGARILSHTRDISERKQAEAAIRENEEQLRGLSDNLADGMVYQINSGPDGRDRQFTYLGLAVERLHGLKVEEVRRDPSLLYDQIVEEDRAFLQEKETLAHATRTTLDVDLRVRLPSGNIRWRRFVSSPRTRPDGSVVWDGIEMDITDRKRAEEALRESEEKYRAVVENSLVGISISDRERILYANRALMDMLGYESFNEMSSKSIPEHLTQESREAAQQWLLRRDRGEQVSSTFEHQVTRKDGRIRILQVAVLPVVVADREVLHAALIDITERKQAEQALLQKEQQLRQLSLQANRRLEKERARVSRELHDELGQILTALNLNLSWLGRRIGDVGSDIVERIDESAQYVSRMLASVRTLSRSLRPVALGHEGLAEAVRSHAVEFEQYANISCEVEVVPPDLAVGEPLAITAFRIIQEALTNVARHSKATRCWVTIEAVGDLLTLKIRDNGTGMDPQGRVSGLSLGIPGMRERAEIIGGSLVIAGDPAGGVCVTAHLPHRNQEQSPADS